MVGMVSREDIERNRQLLLMREYFGKRRMILEIRTKKFLNMYPYVNNGVQINLDKFEKETEEEYQKRLKAYL